MDNEKFTVEFGEVTNIGSGGTSDFDELTNRPKYNDTTMSSDTNIPKVPAKTSDLTNDGSDGDSTYVEADELAKVATSGSYTDLENQPSIPTVNDATLTITQNGTSKGTFTANDADDTTIEVSDTTYSNFTGTDGTGAGAAGLVPAPATTDAGKFLKADGTWDTAGGGGDTVYSTKTTSDGATGGAVYIGNLNSSQQEQPDPTVTDYHFKYFWALPYSNSNEPGDKSINILGTNARANFSIALGEASSVIAGKDYGVAIGNSAIVRGKGSIAIGKDAYIDTDIENSLALGRGSTPTRSGEVNIGAGTTGYGYNSTNYRLLGGVHDPIAAHDAATKGYVDANAGGDTVYSNKSTSNSSTGGAVYIGNLDSSQQEQADPSTAGSHNKFFWALPNSNSKKPTENSINILGEISSSGSYAICFGKNASVVGNYGMSIGANASSVQGSLAIGRYASAGNGNTNRSGCISIGENTISGADYSIVLGNAAGGTGKGIWHQNSIASVAIGRNATIGDSSNGYKNSVALGAYSKATRQGEVNVGLVMGETTGGYDDTAYRVIGGVHDGQLANDAVTVGQINALIDAINSATNSNISHIGS